MAEVPLGAVSEYVRRVAASAGGRADADLLALYARDRDEEAFALLVHRHGPMVLGVCRRALGHTPDAEDAFQATFFALARSARRVRCSVGGWLYRVAVRASRRALRGRPVAQAAEEPADPADPFAALEWREVRRLLDDELHQLPARWRDPLVLTYLEGLSRDEAARQLGWSLRTLHRRLDEGRRALRGRLERRGLAPAALAAAVLSASGLKADVPVSLARSAVALATGGSAVSESVRVLVPRVHTWGGLAMKAAVSALILAGSAVLLLGTREPAGADPKPQEPAPPAALALAPLKKDKPEDALAKDVRAAQEKAIAYLKTQQKGQGGGLYNWENDTLNLLQPGGTSSLAVLALLESGLKADDPVVRRAMPYIRFLEPKHTYVVSLQTQALCRANQKEDAERIKKNMKWLEETAIRKAGQLEGWSYTGGGGGARADNSNTRYAISGLYAAHKAGFKTADPKFWEAVRDYYTRTQKKDGGWGYTPEAAQSTHTMTVSGVSALTLAKDVLGKEDKAAETARRAGEMWVADRLQFANPPHTFYNFDVIAALGRASEKADFGTREKKRDWYREGAEWLLKNQKPTGEWKIEQAIDAFPVVSTSFALRFLASRPD